MPIPEFLIRRLYVEGSYQTEKDGFSFALQNPFIEAHILALSLLSGNKSIEPDKVIIQFPDSPPFSATVISSSKPLIFPIGVQIVVQVLSSAPADGKLVITVETREIGKNSFSIQLRKVAGFSVKGLFRKAQKKSSLRNKLHVDFDDQKWRDTLNTYQAWFDHSLDRPIVSFDPSAGLSLEFLENYPFSVNPDEILDNQQLLLEDVSFELDTYPKWWPNFGPGVAAAFLGAEVQPADDTVWFKPLDIQTIDNINLQNDPNNLWWKRVVAFTESAIRRWGSSVAIGHTDLGGNLDIIASLRGTESLLIDMVENPNEVERLAQDVHHVWRMYYERLSDMIKPLGKGTNCWAACLFPGTGYYLQSDISYMISSKMFERFVLPDLEMACKYLEFPFYHLDGIGQIKHLDMLLSIPNLRGIQWVPGDGQPPAEKWLPLLKKILDAGKLVEVTVSSDGALEIARSLGRRGLQFHIIENLDHGTAENFMTMLRM
jgi:hypothetical protein